MTIDEMIKTLKLMRKKVGGDAQVPVVNVGYGENDYIVPCRGVVGSFVVQGPEEYVCALVGETGGEEFTREGVGHFEWNSEEDAV